uniref:Uncharacterized protein n=1 Tax=Aegilops tauschii subsp. strangulata TaxID=200361 RepID=A0A453D0F9_AEGTS
MPCSLLTAYAKRPAGNAAREHRGDSEFTQPQANVSSKTFSRRAREIERFREQSWLCFTRKSETIEMHRINYYHFSLKCH